MKVQVCLRKQPKVAPWAQDDGPNSCCSRVTPSTRSASDSAYDSLRYPLGPNASPGSNSANYNNDEFNRLYRAGATMQPSPMRTTMYRNMNRMVIDDCATISGISRTLILLWDRKLAMLPDRSFVGGFFARFVYTGDEVEESAAGN